MKTTGIITVVWGLLLIAGGVMGGLKAGSQVSMIAGGLTGVLAILAGAMCLRGQRKGIGAAFGLAVVLALFGFGTWLFADKPFMPRGVIGILSLLEIAVLLPAMNRQADAAIEAEQTPEAG